MANSLFFNPNVQQPQAVSNQPAVTQSPSGQSTNVGSTGASVNTGPEGVAYGQAGTFPSFPAINFDPIPRVVNPVVDPIKRTGEVGAFNLSQFNDAMARGGVNALNLTSLELQGINEFYPGASALQARGAANENNVNRGLITPANRFNRSTVAGANKFNQQQRLQALDFAMPGANKAINAGIERGTQLSEGRFVKDAEDRAFEVASRNTSADSTVSRGFGDDSVFGRRSSDLLSAEQRLNLSQTGDATTSRFLSLGANLSFDQPIKFNPVMQNPQTVRTAQDIRGTPSVPASELAVQQGGAMASLSTISPAQAISFDVGQNEFQSNLDQDRNKFNSTGTFEAAKFDATGAFDSALGQFQTDTFNAQQQAGATNLGHAIDQAQDNFSSGQQTGILTSLGGAAIGAVGTFLGLSAPLSGASALIGGGGVAAGVGAVGEAGAAGAAGVAALSAAPTTAQLGAAIESASTAALPSGGLAATVAGGTPIAAGAAPGTPVVVGAEATPTAGGLPGFGAVASPLAIAGAAALTGKGVYDTIKGLRDGTVTKNDLKRGLSSVFVGGDLPQGANDLLGKPVSQNDMNNAVLLSNPVTAPLALADMIFKGFGGGGKSKQQQTRDTLRDHGVDIGAFFKPDDAQVKSGMIKGSQYVELADGTNYNIGLDGKSKLLNYGPNVDGKPDRYTYDIDWSDKRAPQSVGMLNPAAMIMFGKDYQKMAGHLWNAAASNTKSLSGMKDNMRHWMDNAHITYDTGVKMLSAYKDSGDLSDADYTSFMGGWNDLMLNKGVQNEIKI